MLLCLSGNRLEPPASHSSAALTKDAVKIFKRPPTTVAFYQRVANHIESDRLSKSFRRGFVPWICSRFSTPKSSEAILNTRAKPVYVMSKLVREESCKARGPKTERPRVKDDVSRMRRGRKPSVNPIPAKCGDVYLVCRATKRARKELELRI